MINAQTCSPDCVDRTDNGQQASTVCADHQAWRKNVTGIVPGPLPFFWGVSKTL
jgi:hypothetical protein